MKKLLLILTLLTTFVLTSTAQQEPATPLGNRNSAIRVLGRMYVDSVFYPPLMDYLFGPGKLWRPGAIQSIYEVGNTGPVLPYYWTGSEWKKFILDGDIPPSDWSTLLNKPNGGNYIYNQFGTPQSASIDITGDVRARKLMPTEEIDWRHMATQDGLLNGILGQGGTALIAQGVNSTEVITYNGNLYNRVRNNGSFIWTGFNGDIIAAQMDMGGNLYTNGTFRPGLLATDPTGTNGTMFYNTTSNKFRGYVAGAWQNFATENWIHEQIRVGNIVYVDANNPYSTDNRTGLDRYTLTKPFKTIGAAYAASAYYDIIYVRPGAYYENVMVGNRYNGLTNAFIFDNATLDGGTGYALNFNGDLTTTVYLINSKIKNTGSAADRAGTSAVLASTARVHISGNSAESCIISSVEGHGIRFAANDKTYYDRITVQSTNGNGINAATNAVAIFRNSAIYSTNSTAYYFGGAAQLENTRVVGSTMAIDIANQYHNYTINNSYLEATNGYVIGATSVMGGPGESYTGNIYNSQLKGSQGVTQILVGGLSFGWNLRYDNNKFIVTTGTHAIDMPQEDAQDLTGPINMRMTNTISNVQLFKEGFRSTAAGQNSIVESNTTTADSSVYYGINVGFGTASPLADLHTKGDVILDVQGGTLNASDSVFVEDEATGLVKKVANAAFGGGTSAPPTATPTTLANFTTLYTSKTMVANTTYKITDRPGGDLYITAANDSAIHSRIIRSMLVPSTYVITTDSYGNTWNGIWSPLLEPAPGSLIIWGTRVWKNLTGAVGTSVDDFTLDATNWQLVSPASFTKGEYTLRFFEADYDIANDWISRQYDHQGNSIGMDYGFAVNFWGLTNNPCDYSDWNITTRADYPFYNNHITQFLNNANSGGCYDNLGAYIKNNTNQGSIDNNQTQWGITGNSNMGSISFNRTSEVTSNSNTGSIISNVVSVGISNNSNISDANYGGEIGNNVVGGSLSYNSNVGRIWGNIIPGELSGNSNAGVIEYNTNTGSIGNNTHLGYISYNKNNGDITQNSSTVSVNITRNSNNGNVGNAIRTAHVTDTIVNK